MTTTKTLTTDERTAARIADLRQQRAARKDPDDHPQSATVREVRAYTTETDALDAKLLAIHTAAATLAALDTEADEQWLTFLTTSRATLTAELGTLPSPLRERSAQDKAADLAWSMKLVDHGFGISRIGIADLGPTRIGQLMAASGYATAGEALRGPHGWRGSLSEVDARIKQVTKQRSEAEAALDVALRTDAEIEQQAAEDAARNAVLNAMQPRQGADGRLTAYTSDGEVLSPAMMTEAQKKALSWFEAANLGSRRADKKSVSV